MKYFLYCDFFFFFQVLVAVLLTLFWFFKKIIISKVTQPLKSPGFNFSSNAGLLRFGGVPGTLIWANVIHYQESLDGNKAYKI